MQKFSVEERKLKIKRDGYLCMRVALRYSVSFFRAFMIRVYSISDA